MLFRDFTSVLLVRILKTKNLQRSVRKLPLISTENQQKNSIKTSSWTVTTIATKEKSNQTRESQMKTREKLSDTQFSCLMMYAINVQTLLLQAIEDWSLAQQTEGKKKKTLKLNSKKIVTVHIVKVFSKIMMIVLMALKKHHIVPINLVRILLMIRKIIQTILLKKKHSLNVIINVQKIYYHRK